MWGYVDDVPGWSTTGDDVVWTQMSNYWVASGQLGRGEVDAWHNGGRDEHAFYQLGTRASYGAGWDTAPWSDTAGWGAPAGVSTAWGSGSPDAVAGAWW